MDSVSQSETSLTLVLRLTRSPSIDQIAWQEFVESYGTRIYKWCRGWGLQDADARDVTQQVMLRLARKLPEFSYDPQRSFRAWLRTLTHHAWQDFLTGQQRSGQNSGNSPLNNLSSVEAREDLLQRLGEEFDLELLHRAMATVEARLEPATWEAFRLTAIENCSATDVARLLGKKVATVYVARSKVQRLLQEEVARLRAEQSGII